MEMLCEHMSKKYFPLVRKKIANYLFYGMGYKQEEIAHLLGITQAAVSQYLKEARGSSKNAFLPEDVELKIPELAEGLIRNAANPSRFNYLCEVCKIMRNHVPKDKVFIPSPCK